MARRFYLRLWWRYRVWPSLRHLFRPHCGPRGVSEQARRHERFWVATATGYRRRAESHRETPEVVFEAERVLSLQPRTVLELGSNYGPVLHAIRRLAPNVRTIGMDVSQPPLRDLPQDGVQGSVYKLPFRDGSIDVVLTRGVFIHVPPADLPAALKEAARVARRGLVFIEHYSPEPDSIPIYQGSHTIFRHGFDRVGPTVGLKVRSCEIVPRPSSEAIGCWILEHA